MQARIQGGGGKGALPPPPKKTPHKYEFVWLNSLRQHNSQARIQGGGQGAPLQNPGSAYEMVQLYQTLALTLTPDESYHFELTTTWLKATGLHNTCQKRFSNVVHFCPQLNLFLFAGGGGAYKVNTEVLDVLYYTVLYYTICTIYYYCTIYSCL